MHMRCDGSLQKHRTIQKEGLTSVLVNLNIVPRGTRGCAVAGLVRGNPRAELIAVRRIVVEGPQREELGIHALVDGQTGARHAQLQLEPKAGARGTGGDVSDPVTRGVGDPESGREVVRFFRSDFDADGGSFCAKVVKELVVPLSARKCFGNRNKMGWICSSRKAEWIYQKHVQSYPPSSNMKQCPYPSGVHII